MKRITSIKNGKKGGRPVSNSDIRFEIPNITFVILTETQYNTLLEKYGYKLVKKALKLLEEWLSTTPAGLKHVGKNNYGYFRSDGWVINTAIRK